MTAAVTATMSGLPPVGRGCSRSAGPVTGPEAVTVTVPVTRPGTVLSHSRLAGTSGLELGCRGAHAASTHPARTSPTARAFWPRAAAPTSHGRRQNPPMTPPTLTSEVR